VDWAGTMRPNLILSEVTVSPERVQVTGPKRILDTITTLYTEKIYVDDLERSGTVTAQISFGHTSLRLAPGARDRVTVDFLVKERVT
jgi:diadenylate cyclase